MKGSLSHVTEFVFVTNSAAQMHPHLSLYHCVYVCADATHCKPWCQLALGAKNGLLGLLKHLFWEIWKGACEKKKGGVWCTGLREWMKGSSGIRSDYVWCYQACEPACQSLHHSPNDGAEHRREFVCLWVSPFVINLSEGVQRCEQCEREMLMQHFEQHLMENATDLWARHCNIHFMHEGTNLRECSLYLGTTVKVTGQLQDKRALIWKHDSDQKWCSSSELNLILSDPAEVAFVNVQCFG